MNRIDMNVHHVEKVVVKEEKILRGTVNDDPFATRIVELHIAGGDVVELILYGQGTRSIKVEGSTKGGQ